MVALLDPGLSMVIVADNYLSRYIICGSLLGSGDPNEDPASVKEVPLIGGKSSGLA